jgi:predicted site-specific integrase-resolvase
MFRLCHSFGVGVVVVERADSRFEDRLVQDVLELMTVFSAKLYMPQNTLICPFG